MIREPHPDDAPPRSPLRAALLTQAAATALVLGVLAALPDALAWPWALVALQAALASAISASRGDPGWWWLIHALFAPLVFAARELAIDPTWYLAAFLLSFLVFWRTDVSRVPLYLSNRQTADALLRLLPAHAAQVIDLGCGDARLLARLARARPDCRFVGIEHAPLTWLWARATTLRVPNLEVRHGDFWREELAPYDLVYAFLSPAPMARLIAHARRKMKQGALLVSNSFMAPGAEPSEVVEVADRRHTRLYCYRISKFAARGRSTTDGAIARRL